MFMNCLCLSIFWKIAEFTFPCYWRTAYNGAVYQWYLVLFFSTSQWFGTIMESQTVQNSRIQIWSHSRITITFNDHIRIQDMKINQIQQASRSYSRSYITFNMNNACTLVPTVFRWHGKKDFKCHIHFSFSHGIENQIWILLFVFRFRLTLKNGFELRISFFVFGSLWKTDLNFVCRFLITLKIRSEFRLSFLHGLKNGSLHQFSHLKPPPPPRGWPGHSLFM